jgi:hypothetical protein
MMDFRLVRLHGLKSIGVEQTNKKELSLGNKVQLLVGFVGWGL